MTGTLGNKQYGIIGLTLATAVIHLVLAVQFGDVLFGLNFLGYVGLLAILYPPVDLLTGYRGLARWVLMGYAALTIILYFVMNPTPLGSVLGLITKAIEVALIALLWTEQT